MPFYEKHNLQHQKNSHHNDRSTMYISSGTVFYIITLFPNNDLGKHLIPLFEADRPSDWKQVYCKKKEKKNLLNRKALAAVVIGIIL